MDNILAFYQHKMCSSVESALQSKNIILSAPVKTKVATKKMSKVTGKVDHQTPLSSLIYNGAVVLLSGQPLLSSIDINLCAVALGASKSV